MFAKPEWVAHGVIECQPGDELDTANELCEIVAEHNTALVAIEDYARRFVSPKAAQQMIQAAQSCGMIRGLLTAWLEPSSGVDVVAYPANVWRKAIVGNGSAKDAKIEWALRELHHVTDMPRRTNAHVRDACGLAIYAGREVDQ